MNFRIEGLAPDAFQPLFWLDEESLAARGARRQVADHKPGFPCRVSLEDAEPGEEVLLLNYEHHAVDTPYRASGPISLRKGATAWRGAAGEFPAMLPSRPLPIRGYTPRGTMQVSDVCDGSDLDSALLTLFEDSRISTSTYNAKPGCFIRRVDRRSSGQYDDHDEAPGRTPEASVCSMSAVLLGRTRERRWAAGLLQPPSRRTERRVADRRGRERATWIGGTSERRRGSSGDGQRTSVPVSAIALRRT